MAESCFDPQTHRPRLLAEQCATCIYRPGNPMHLRPGRLREMTQAALREGSQGVICHDTLPYGANPDFGGALCRGFYDAFGHQNGFIRVRVLSGTARLERKRAMRLAALSWAAERSLLFSSVRVDVLKVCEGPEGLVVTHEEGRG